MERSDIPTQAGEQRAKNKEQRAKRMNIEKKSPTWQKPWKYKEGFIIAGGLFLTGLLLNHFSPVNVDVPGWPVNIIIGLVFSAILVFLHFSFRENYLVNWLSGIPACMSAIAFFALLTLCIGLIPQAEGKDSPVLLFKLNFLKQSWLFLISTVYLLTCLGLVTLRRCIPFNINNIGFIANHLGLWLIVLAAGLSAGDFQRYQFAVEEGQTVSQGVNIDYITREFPFSIQLIDFTIGEFPAKIALVDIETNKINTKVKNNLTLIEEGIKFKVKDYRIEVLKYLPSATYLDSGYAQTDDSMAVQAAFLKCVNVKTNNIVEGWISSGSPKLKPAFIRVDSNYIIAMTLPDPKKFSSKIIVTNSKGRKEMVHLEVNRPFKVEGWKLYQIGYDKEMGKYSRLSIIEAVRDPWIPVVYIGVILLMLGAGYMFWMGRK